MEEKDYKKLAEINKAHRKLCISKGINPIIIDSISKHQADYLEKEGFEFIPTKHKQERFNREQFLKWCGVEE